LLDWMIMLYVVVNTTGWLPLTFFWTIFFFKFRSGRYIPFPCSYLYLRSVLFVPLPTFPTCLLPYTFAHVIRNYMYPVCMRVLLTLRLSLLCENIVNCVLTMLQMLALNTYIIGIRWQGGKYRICKKMFIHSFSSLSHDRSKASSKASSPRSAIYSFLLEMIASFPFLAVIQIASYVFFLFCLSLLFLLLSFLQ
jgi:nitrate reductase NapE component